jgi:pyruvate dehydrogenase E2 component (dihydrolipoamide acetyltransferase)
MPVLLPDNRTITVTLPDCGNKSLAEFGFCFKRLMEKLKNTNIDIALLDVGWDDTIKRLKCGDFFNPLGRVAGLRLGKNKLKRVDTETRKGYAGVPQETRLGTDDLTMGTITVSNLGSVIRGTKGFPVLIDLISPQVLMAIGIGSLQEKPVVTDAGITAGTIILFCMVFDHRALDFGDVAPLLRRMDSVFQKPEIIHAW